MNQPKRGFFGKPEIISLIVIFILLLLIFIPKCGKHILREKASEAFLNLRKIYDGEIIYYCEMCKSHEKGNANFVPQFISAPSTPQGKPTKDKRVGNWDHPSWRALKFNPKEPVRYVYKAEAIKNGFALFAYGDLDGDGTTSLFQRGETYERMDCSNELGAPCGGEIGGSGLYKLNEYE